MVEEAVKVGSNERMFAVITLCGIIGVIFAIIFQLLYEQSTIIDSFVDSELTLRELQFGVILAWEILGIGVGVIRG